MHHNLTNMKLAVGPLTTGTYIGHPVVHEGKYIAVHKTDDGNKMGATEDKEHEGIKWHFEKLGENRYKVRNISSGLRGITINTEDKETIEASKDEGFEWIVETTDAVGEYTARPAHDPTIYAAATENESVYKVGPPKSSPEKMRVKVYRVDDD